MNEVLSALAMREVVAAAEVRAAKKKGDKDRQVKMLKIQISLTKELVRQAEKGHVPRRGCLFLCRQN